MKILTLALALSGIALAHEGGHGPKIKDPAPHGGVIAGVIDAKDEGKGAKAPIVYKAELVRSEAGKVRVYFFDRKMKPLDLSRFERAAKGAVEISRRKQVQHTPFEFKAEGDCFVGTAPKPSKKPFTIEITVKENERSLMASFGHLD